MLVFFLFFGAVSYSVVAVRVKLRFGGSFEAILEGQVGNVALHGEATCALGVDFCVIPLEVYAGKLCPFEILRDGVMLGEDSY